MTLARPVFAPRFASRLSALAGFVGFVGFAGLVLLVPAEAGAQSADTLYRTLRSAESLPQPAPGPTAPAGDPTQVPLSLDPSANDEDDASRGARVPRQRARDEIDPDFRLGVGDVLSVSVLEDSSLDRQLLVRPDGRVSMPLAGAPRAVGRTPEQLAGAIRAGLSDDFIEPPTVTVALVGLGFEAEDQDDEDAFPVIYVLGEVNRPGSFTVREPVGLLQALALAGGPGIFAAKERVQVRRVTELGVEEVLLVDYEALEEGAAAPLVLLGDGDTVMVPERGLFE